QNSKDSEPATPTNIIFLIGDGMGLSAVSTTFYFQENPSQFNRFKHIGLIKTSSATHKVTDSGASGTAMATGHKTYNGAIGVDTTKTAVQSIAELKSNLAWSTGVVATSAITHATPASFYAHVERRSMEDDIAFQLLHSEIDFFAGGGKNYFNKRADSANLFSLADEKGFLMDTVALSAPGSMEAGKKYGYLLADGGMPSMQNNRGDFLADATGLAIELLSKNEKGFFLMVEGSQIDWEEHGNNADGTIAEVLDFEQAIAAALDFAEKDGNTLVVVTADHETGGLSLSAKLNPETGGRDYKEIGPDFATGSHSATLIPVFAFGPGAKEFMGIYENTELFYKMAAFTTPE
ncbi:MAG: alkaline phosphatase, partial [Bacteroides sp.]|nr:alkaline phosphatase [Bacteroides sp.]